MIDPKTIGAHIRMHRQNMTKTEQKVIDYILQKNDFTDDTPIKEVALQNQVSEGFIVKLAKKLDFDGYRDLRANLVEYKKLDVAQLFNEISPKDTSAQLVDKIFHNAIQALEETMAIVNIHDIERCVTLLSDANEINLYGVGGSFQVAQDLSHKLLRIGIRSQAYSDSNLMLMSSALCNDKSVVIAISHSGKTIDVVEAVKKARQAGAKTIVLTNYANSAITEYADVVLKSTSQGTALLGENASARIAQLTVLDVIFVAIAQKNIKTSEENLIKTRSSVENKSIH